MRTMIFAATAALLLASSAQADDTPPWTVGVTTEQQDAAKKLLKEGNELYAQQAYPSAAEKYREALKHWGHPVIHNNLARSLVQLEKILEAADEIDLALKYEGKPFENPELYDAARLLYASLKGQVGFIEVSCNQAGAKVSLDGQALISCPGTQKVRVLAKEHTVFAELKDHLSVSRRIVVAGDGVTKHDVKLLPIDKAVKLTYKYPKWAPWTIAGIGGALAIGGVFTYNSARSLMGEFEDDFKDKYPQGTSRETLKAESPRIADKESAAKTRGGIGISMMAVGGTALVGGLFFGLVINRPYREIPKIDFGPTPGGAAASYTVKF